MATEVKTTEARGNTKTRAYQLTLNEMNRLNELVDNIKSYKSLQYLCVGAIEKAPTTGHEHVHIYAYFHNPIKLNIKKCCGAHVEQARGSPKQNIEYLTKEGEPTLEFGEKPRQGQMTVKDLKEMNKDECPATLYKIKKAIDTEENDKNEFFKMLDEIRNDELKAPEVIYFSGATGKGKTYTGYKYIISKGYSNEEIGKLTLKNDFVDVVNDKAKAYIIEEFRDSQIRASDFLQLTDKYGYRCNIKGGFQTLRPELLVICSIKNPREIYSEEVNKQFLRRITKFFVIKDDKVMDKTESIREFNGQI